jgi:hypothetical protein
MDEAKKRRAAEADRRGELAMAALGAASERACKVADDLEGAPAVEIDDPSVVRQLKRVRTQAEELGRDVDERDKTPLEIPFPRPRHA